MNRVNLYHLVPSSTLLIFNYCELLQYYSTHIFTTQQQPLFSISNSIQNNNWLYLDDKQAHSSLSENQKAIDGVLAITNDTIYEAHLFYFQILILVTPILEKLFSFIRLFGLLLPYRFIVAHFISVDVYFQSIFSHFSLDLMSHFARLSVLNAIILLKDTLFTHPSAFQ